MEQGEAQGDTTTGFPRMLLSGQLCELLFMACFVNSTVSGKVQVFRVADLNCRF